MVDRDQEYVEFVEARPAGRSRGGHHDVKVVDGWYSVAWLNNDPLGRPDGKLTAYDKNGNILKVLPA